MEHGHGHPDVRAALLAEMDAIAQQRAADYAARVEARRRERDAHQRRRRAGLQQRHARKLTQIGGAS